MELKHFNCQRLLLCKSSMMFFAFFLMISMMIFPQSSEANDQDFDVNDYVKEMQPGWNLGNTFDAVGEDETAWGNPFVTKELIEEIANQGFNSIRIPVTFDQRMAEGPDYTIDEDFLNRVTQAVDWSLDEDLYVMINIHHDSWIWLEAGMHEDYDESIARFDAIWEQLADHFKDYPMELMFESINEPRFWGSEEEKLGYLYDLNMSFYDIVRNSGGMNDIRPLVLPTLDTSPDHQHTLDHLYDTIIELDDPNLISTIHFYGFWPFSVNVAGYTHFDEETKGHIIETFDRVYDTFTANDIPVVLGEFGLLGFDTHTGVIQQGEKLKFFEFMIHYAKEKEITHMLWDNGQHFNRTSFEWRDQELYDIMKASWETRSATAESNFIYLKRGEEIEDTSLQLHLHGNEFVSLLLDGQTLIEGEDYELNGDALIINASLLEELTTSQDLGVNAKLTATFTQGADWYIRVISYDTPVMEDASGTVRDFVIPTQFNGDDLKTMEAIYPDGSAAGPHNWTTFKEFGYAFSPDYEANEIYFPYGEYRFFNELNDGEVELTFYFWSGEVLTYQLTKDGENIVGTFVGATPPGTGDDDETPGAGDDGETPGTGDDGETPGTGDDDKTPGTGEDDETPGTGEDDETPGAGDNGETPGTGDDDKTPSTGSSDETKLPDTATNLYNYLLIGLLMIIVGGTVTIFSRKRKVVDM
ncbi:cellulase family glycosylhydrolase [Evansella cellulosilytica]|nr:cellulase family glycosylhydrolase [Evansella cellulosilytica]